MATYSCSMHAYLLYVHMLWHGMVWVTRLSLQVSTVQTIQFAPTIQQRCVGFAWQTNVYWTGTAFEEKTLYNTYTILTCKFDRDKHDLLYIASGLSITCQALSYWDDLVSSLVHCDMKLHRQLVLTMQVLWLCCPQPEYIAIYHTVCSYYCSTLKLRQLCCNRT